MNPRLTTKQEEALRMLLTGPRSPFAFGSTTVHRLRELGLIVNLPGDQCHEIELTAEGRVRAKGLADRGERS